MRTRTPAVQWNFKYSKERPLGRHSPEVSGTRSPFSVIFLCPFGRVRSLPGAGSHGEWKGRFCPEVLRGQGSVFPPGDIWDHLEAFSIRAGDGVLLTAEGRGRGCCRVPTRARTGPTTQLTPSVAGVALRNSGTVTCSGEEGGDFLENLLFHEPLP